MLFLFSYLISHQKAEKSFVNSIKEMIKPFINDDFLLESKMASRLYHEFSEDLPIIDFHCHLSPSMIAEDRQFENLCQAWLEGDHYKWRAMRINGVEEKYCTGNASDKDKFRRWAETVPSTIGNPLYHWTQLELARYFGIYELLSPSTSDKIYNQASEMLTTPEFSTQSLIRKMKVEVICTTDDPVDNLEFHIRLKRSFDVKVLPTFRPDNVLKTDVPSRFREYINKLSSVSNIAIESFPDLIAALDSRHEYFHQVGGRLSDHGLDRFYFLPCEISESNKIFRSLLDGKVISAEETEKFRTSVMLQLCRMNHKRSWTQQFHVGAIRNNNSRKFRLLGPDTGWDSIGSTQDAYKMSAFLSSLDESDQLSKTIIYNLNPSDNQMMITMAGNFNDGTIPGKVQYGAAWWFLDQKAGMDKHLEDLSSLGLLRRFIGMVTDSRSFLSYPRHEYFRRIACNYIGNQVDKGLIPDEDELLRPLIEGISYRNAREYLGI